ncbi:VPA1269 family protein [Rhizobium johnstonii]|uniref:VPA1269 family protein n=1 Tax=Rhizobium johnstonii TaxID=3019933 RepID=UPI003F9A244F
MEVYSESHVKYFDEDGGCTVNVSDHIVLLADPQTIDLEALWWEFDRTLRRELKLLLKTEYGQIVQKYGLLNFNERYLVERHNTLLGLFLRGKGSKLHVFENAPVVRALVDLKLVHGGSAKGGRWQNTYSGTTGDFVATLPEETQLEIIDRVLNDDLDDAIRLGQRETLGMSDLETTLFRGKPRTVDALRSLAGLMESNVAPVDRSEGVFSGTGTGRAYAPIWFAQFLAARGVWLFPLRFYDRILAFWPYHLRPLLLLLSVPPHSRDVADGILATFDRDLTTLRQVPSAFVMAALSSTMWSERRFCPAALFHMKMHYGTADQGRSSSINHVYTVLAEVFDVDFRERGEARLLDGRKRASSIEAFRWIEHPTASNMKKASRILGRDWSEIKIPDHTRQLAAEMRELLPSFKVQNMRAVRNAVDYFLIYSVLLGPELRIGRLRDITRHHHVRSEVAPHETFYEFLLSRCLAVGSDSARSAMSKMQDLWKAGAARGGYDRHVPCPFDATFDRLPSKKKERGRAGRALEKEVIDLLIEINRSGGWAFARSLSTSYAVVRNPDGVFERMFWPLAPLALEISLRTGHRLRTVRWLDSGEGDEQTYDPVTMTHSRNTLPCAIAGRNQFAIRYLRLDDAERTPVNAMYLCVAKSGAYESVYLPEELIEPICELRDLQIRYNPMNKPVPAVDNRARTAETDDDLFSDVFHLFRSPDRFQDVLSDAKMRTYYKAFLKYAQPIVAERLGRDYPLVDLERDLALTTFHDHRRSLVTNGEERGVPISVLRQLLGQASNETTNIYNRVRSRRIHAITQHGTYDAALIEGIAQNQPEALTSILEQVEAVAGAESPAAIRMREVVTGKRPAFLDIFMHGLCIVGDCATGRIKAGHRIPVWRPRACGGCMYRGTGYAFRAGVINRINLLTIELRMSGTRSIELNDRIGKESAAGRPVKALEKGRATEEELRRNLTDELRLEQDILRRIDAAAKAARIAGRSPNSVVISNAVFDFDKVETVENRVHEFELLLSVMRDVVIIPAAAIELPPVVPFEAERQVRAILRANKLEEVMHRIPESDKVEALVAIGDVLLDLFGEVEEFQRVLDESRSGIPQPAIEAVAHRIREAAERPSGPLLGSLRGLPFASEARA